MTIKARLWLLASAAFIGLVVVFSLGRLGINGVQNNFNIVADNSLPNIELLDELDFAAVAFQRDVREAILQNDPARQEIVLNRLAESRKNINRIYDKLSEVLTSDEGKALLKKAIELRKPNAAVHTKAMALAKEGKRDEAVAFLTSDESEAAVHNYRNSFKALVAHEKAAANIAIARGKDEGSAFQWWMLIGSFLTVTVLLILSFIVVRAISSAIEDIVTKVKHIATNMVFTTRLEKRNDELNAISDSLNTMLQALNHGVSDIKEITQSLAAGDFSQRITNVYAGDLEALKQTINQSVDNIDKVITEMSNTMNALQQGRFSTTINSNAPGAYSTMLTAARQTMQTLNTVIASLNTVMAQMTAGDFSGRVEVESQGELLTMKDMVNQSMNQIEQAMKSIITTVQYQSEGDLTHECQQTFAGELEATKNALNTTNNRLKEVISQAVEAANIVSDAANQVSQGSADLSSRVQQQAAALEQTSATMNEMSAAVQANTANARKVAELTSQAQMQAKDSVQVMQQTIGAMQSIKDASSKINDIVSIIDSIAFQTNLLALNAAVEAARAGEHGRGFAVVASEVRALAGKSADAAKDIKTLITDSVSRIENGTQLADKSGAMLSEITNSIEHVASMIEEIAGASNEQSVGIGHVHLAIADIDRVTQENAALVEETTAAAESLSAEANNLHQSMTFFKTGSANAMPRIAKQHTVTKSKTAIAALPATVTSSSAPTQDWNEF